MMPNQDGLEWVPKTFGLEPQWTRTPDINVTSRIIRKELDHNFEMPIKITFHAQGAFNKLYKVSVAGSDYLMRVSLPVDPYYKTESEVATLRFMLEQKVPVPRIVAYSSDNQNELGFEWILMELVLGVTLSKKWRKISWSAKIDIVKRLSE